MEIYLKGRRSDLATERSTTRDCTTSGTLVKPQEPPDSSVGSDPITNSLDLPQEHQGNSVEMRRFIKIPVKCSSGGKGAKSAVIGGGGAETWLSSQSGRHST